MLVKHNIIPFPFYCSTNMVCHKVMQHINFNRCVPGVIWQKGKAVKSDGLSEVCLVYKGTLRMGSMYGRIRRGALETRCPSILALCSLFLPTPLCSSSVKICGRNKRLCHFNKGWRTHSWIPLHIMCACHLLE